MTDLTSLTLAEARDGLRAKAFSATELTRAHVAAVEAARQLNAYVLETPDSALAAAAVSDERLGRGEGRPLEGLPLGIKDLFCTEGVRTTACSRVLGEFVPAYESTVTAQLWRHGALMLGKLNNDEFAMGSSNETSRFGPVVSPWRRRGSNVHAGGQGGAIEGSHLVPGGSSGGSAAAVAARLCLGATATDTGGSIRQPAAFTEPSASSRPMAAARGGASWPSRRRSIRRDPSPGRSGIARSCSAPWRARTSRTRPRRTVAVPDFEAAVDRGVKGLTIGIPKEYRLPGMPEEIEALWARGAEMMRDAGATIVDVSLPHTKYALPAYYIVAPAEASSNLARYDGVRYGIRTPGRDITDLYEGTRAEGFGREVQRRIMIGTYVLSAGYYDAYYVRAQKIRTLIKRDFEEVYAAGVDAILTPATPSAAFAIGEKGSADPVEMYLNDIFTVTVNMAGLPGSRCRPGSTRTDCRSGSSSSGDPSTRRPCSQRAR
jgi:aspartyl-tRNA(Asn)/glutamyl-tRNA(Gln) amidotransferase subunit A